MANQIITTDVAPAISADYTSRLQNNIKQLNELLSASAMRALPAGSAINVYKMTKVNSPAQVAEGVAINLTEFKREIAKTLTLGLKKYRKETTAEAILKAGRDVAVNATDEALVREIQKDIKSDIFTAIKTGIGTATAGATLQAQIANLWAAMAAGYEDEDFSPIYFVNPVDVATYLGTAAITTQTAFGFSYVENFLGMGTAILTPSVTAKNVWATAKENLIGYYAPVGGDLGAEFGLTADESGLVGMRHTVKDDNATISTLAMTACVFAPEVLTKVYKGVISAS